LEQPGGQADHFVGQIGAGDARFAGGEDGEAQALEFEVEEIAQAEDFVVGHQQATVERLLEVGAAVAGKVSHRIAGQGSENGGGGGGFVLKDLPIA
jgi:hypothetical protein